MDSEYSIPRTASMHGRHNISSRNQFFPSPGLNHHQRNYSSDTNSRSNAPSMPTSPALTTSPTRKAAPGLPARRPSLTVASPIHHPHSPTFSSRSPSIQTSSGFLPQYPHHHHQQSSAQNQRFGGGGGSVAESTSGGSVPRFLPPPESLMKGLESTTSSSLLHGLNMILIMLCSLGAFICALVQNACEDPATYGRCSDTIAASFFLVNICSCVTFFVMYFLHLVGQCDYLSWSARRKVTLELMGTLFVLLAVVTVTILVYVATPAWSQETTRFGILFSGASVTCILVRVLLLAREIPMLLSKPQADARSALHDHLSHKSSASGSVSTTAASFPVNPMTGSLHSRTGSPAVETAELIAPLQHPPLPSRRRSVRRKKRTLSAVRSFSLKRSSVAETIDLESGIPCAPMSPSTVTFTRMAILQSNDFLPGNTGSSSPSVGFVSGNSGGTGNRTAGITSDSARSSMTTTIPDHVFRSSSELDDRSLIASNYPKVTHV